MTENNNISAFDPGQNGKKKLSEGKLMAYLEGKLSPAEQRDVEKWLADEGMESDALEGLNMLGPTETRIAVGKLNHKLRKTLSGKGKRRKPLKTEYVTWAAIIFTLLLAISVYIVIRLIK
jgi:hypothetical protein